MQRIDTYEFYKLGQQIHALENLSKDYTLRQVFFLWMARAGIDAVLENKIIFFYGIQQLAPV